MEKLSRVLSDFAVEPEKMTRVRGGFLMETGDGLRMLQEYRGGTAKLALVEALQRSLREQGFFRTDLLLRSKKGEFSSRDVDGTIYVLKEWFAGQECSRESRGDFFAGIELLAGLHMRMERTDFAADIHMEKERKKQTDGRAHAADNTENGEEKAADKAESGEEKAADKAESGEEKVADNAESGEKRAVNGAGGVEEKKIRDIRKAGSIGAEDLRIIFEKRIRELRRGRNYLKSRRRKTDYESELLKHADYYISCGEEALSKLSASDYEKQREAAMKKGTIVHGAYHYHNIIILAEKHMAGRKPCSVAAAVNFERMAVGLQVTDVYDFIRKILEKNAWNRELGYRLLERYQRERPMSAEEMEILQILFLFPEKYWKLVNHYCNHSKSWLPGKNPEKLSMLVRQEEARMKFVEGL